ncbi:hypothetical protein [Candidatus Deferrimicrobium sp.]|uniref:hypothetical protein n=1 Tax=Candidatus Deferrimicrobium sp. TaxID=3060586 RepID=UPI003C474988
MRPAEWLQEARMRRFEEAYDGWIEKRLSQEEAARILGVGDRTFRCYVERYDDGEQVKTRDPFVYLMGFTLHSTPFFINLSFPKVSSYQKRKENVMKHGGIRSTLAVLIRMDTWIP